MRTIPVINQIPYIAVFDQIPIDYDNLCPICYDQMEENNRYKIEECKHEFHTNCIITWLRSEHSTCPICNGVPDNKIRSRRSETDRFKLILNYSRRKNVCKKVLHIVNKYKIYNKKYINIRKEFTLFKKLHKNIFKQRHSLNRKVWSSKSKADRLKRYISNIPIQPLIIK